MNRLIRTLFFVSALAPAVIISAAIQLLDNGGTAEVLGWITAGSIACLLPLLVIAEASRRAEQLSFSAKKVEPQEWVLVAFVVSYFIPLIVKVENLQVFAFVFLLAAVFLATLEAIPCHPVLHLFRFRFYKVEGANGMVYTLIARRKILSAADIKKVRQLSSQLLMEI